MHLIFAINKSKRKSPMLNNNEEVKIELILLRKKLLIDVIMLPFFL